MFIHVNFSGCGDEAKLFSMCFSWSDRRPAHRALQSDCSAGSLHDRWLHDVAQPFHHWNALPFSRGQSVTAPIWLSASLPI